MKGYLYKSLFFLLMEVLVLIVLIPSRWIETIKSQEFDAVSNITSPEVASEINVNANSLYVNLFDKTGIEKHATRVFYPDEERRRRSVGMQDLGSRTWFPWIKSRGEAVREMLNLTFFRLSYLYYWVPLMLLISIPALFDGIMTWWKHQYNFDRGSTVFQHATQKVLLFFVVLFTIGALLPVPIPGIILPAVSLFLVPLYWIITISSLPKRF